MDTLNTEAHNLQLEETLKRTEDELNAKDRVIDKYRLEIRQRNDEIEKKASREPCFPSIVDRFHVLRMTEKLLSKFGTQQQSTGANGT